MGSPSRQHRYEGKPGDTWGWTRTAADRARRRSIVEPGDREALRSRATHPRRTRRNIQIVTYRDFFTVLAVVNHVDIHGTYIHDRLDAIHDQFNSYPRCYGSRDDPRLMPKLLESVDRIALAHLLITTTHENEVMIS